MIGCHSQFEKADIWASHFEGRAKDSFKPDILEKSSDFLPIHKSKPLIFLPTKKKEQQAHHKVHESGDRPIL